MSDDVYLQRILRIILLWHESSLMRLVGLRILPKIKRFLQITSLLHELKTAQVVFESLLTNLIKEHFFTYLLIVIKFE